jgi:tetratricopeptide (TPR) repeat protein
MAMGQPLSLRDDFTAGPNARGSGMKTGFFPPNQFGLLILILIISLFSWSEGRSESYDLLGQDRLRNIAIVEDHSEVLIQWVKKGIRNITLINIDTHDDIQRIPPEKIGQLKELYHQKDISALRKTNSLSDKGLYDIGNFIYAAGKLGIIKDIYWIIPFSYFSHPDVDKSLKKFLKSYSFPDGVIKTFKVENGCFRGEIDGIPFNICGIEELPTIDHPVLLSIDIDFLPYLSVEYGVNKLEAIKMLFGSLYKRKYKVKDAVVAYSVNGGYTTVSDRWLGNVILEMLKEPALLSDPKPPELWTILQTADIYIKENKPKEVIQYLLPLLETYKNHPALLIYVADAYYLLNDIEKAFYYAEKSCLIDKKFCYILPYIGKYLVIEGRLSEAEQFFTRGYNLNPEMNYLQGDFAIALKKAGRYHDALKYFEILKSMNGSFPSDFMMGEVYLLLGDERAAMSNFDRGRDFLKGNPNIEIKNPEIADAMISAVKFYEKNAYKNYAEEISKNPRLKSIFEK